MILNYNKKTTLTQSGFLILKIKMKPIELPFEIGREYENWEFDLEVLDVERMKGYDSYIYIREIVFLGAIPRYVELIFLIDILQIAILKYELQKSDLRKIIKILDEKLMLKDNSEKIKIYSLDANLELWVINKESNTIIVSYGIPYFLSQLFSDKTKNNHF